VTRYAYHSDVEEKKAEDGGFSLTDDNRYALYECHVEMCVPGVDDEDDLPLPYVVTIERGSGEVLAVYRNYEEDAEIALKNQYFVHYPYVPGFGFYALGFDPHHRGLFARGNVADSAVGGRRHAV
jgi:hypothetical protein